MAGAQVDENFLAPIGPKPRLRPRDAAEAFDPALAEPGRFKAKVKLDDVAADLGKPRNRGTTRP